MTVNVKIFGRLCVPTYCKLAVWCIISKSSSYLKGEILGNLDLIKYLSLNLIKSLDELVHL